MRAAVALALVALAGCGLETPSCEEAGARPGCTRLSSGVTVCRDYVCSDFTSAYTREDCGDHGGVYCAVRP